MGSGDPMDGATRRPDSIDCLCVLTIESGRGRAVHPAVREPEHLDRDTANREPFLERFLAVQSRVLRVHIADWFEMWVILIEVQHHGVPRDTFSAAKLTVHLGNGLCFKASA